MSTCALHGALDVYASGACRPCARARMKEWSRKKKLGLSTARVWPVGVKRPMYCVECGTERPYGSQGRRCMDCAKKASNEKLREGKDAAEWAAIFLMISKKKPKVKA